MLSIHYFLIKQKKLFGRPNIIRYKIKTSVDCTLKPNSSAFAFRQFLLRLMRILENSNANTSGKTNTSLPSILL